MWSSLWPSWEAVVPRSIDFSCFNGFHWTSHDSALIFHYLCLPFPGFKSAGLAYSEALWVDGLLPGTVRLPEMPMRRPRDVHTRGTLIDPKWQIEKNNYVRRFKPNMKMMVFTHLNACENLPSSNKDKKKNSCFYWANKNIQQQQIWAKTRLVCL